MTTVAEIVISTLNQAGVKRIYGIVGDSLNSMTHELSRQKNIQWIHTRHEEVAAFAAGAEAQLTGELTVCAGSCGPGNVHLINGLYDCHRSQAPVLAIAAQIPSSEVGGDYFQETHPNILFKECSCFCEVVTYAEQMPRLLHIAMQAAIAKRGVAVLVIPGDIACQSLPKVTKPHWTPTVPPIIYPTQKELQQTADLLNASEKITLFCGIGAAKAHDAVIQFATALQAPIVHTLRGKPYMEYENPFDVGMTGLIGFASGYYAIESCETLVLLGTSFPYRQFYPKKARIIQIDIAGEQLGKRTPIDIGLVGDVKLTIEALLPLIKIKPKGPHLEKALAHYQSTRKQLNDLPSPEVEEVGIRPQYLTQTINDLAAKDTIFTCDVGTPTLWSARYLKMNGQRCLLGSFNHGSMANALAQAIGAQLSHPDRQVIALCGDGGLSMLLGDMLTLIQHQLPIKIIVFNNKALDFVRLEMHAVGMMDSGTDLCPTDFARIATSMGILGIKIEHAAELKANIATALSHEGPALVDVRINPNELALPPTITLEEAKGFGLYMLKAILNGEGREIIHIVKDGLTSYLK